MDKLLFKRIIVGLLVLSLLIYIVYLFAGANFGKSVEIEEAVNIEVSDTIYSQAFIVRDESYITNSQSGVTSFNIGDGDEVSKNQVIADIYNSETDAVNRQRIKEIESRITNLKTLSETYYKDSVSFETANTQVNNSIFTMLKNINTGNLSAAKNNSDSVLLAVCARQMLTGDVKDFSAKINELRREKSKLESASHARTGTISAPKAGYFISGTDGYEKSVSYKNIDKLSLEKFNKIKKKSKPANVLGKLVTNPQWYVACRISADDSVSLAKLQNLGKKIYIMMPAITTEKIPVTIHAINQRSKQDDGVLVLTCDYMNSYIAKARDEEIEITCQSYEGLKVAKRALHEDYVEKTVEKDGETITKKKKVQGVYVLHGSELVFKQVSIIYSASDYVLCSPSPEKGQLFNGTTIQLYDQVVVKGDDLKDGKVIT